MNSIFLPKTAHLVHVVTVSVPQHVFADFTRHWYIKYSVDFFPILSYTSQTGSWIWFKTDANSTLRDHSGYGLGQWEEALHSNAFSHWLSPYPEWSLHTAPRSVGCPQEQQLSFSKRLFFSLLKPQNVKPWSLYNIIHSCLVSTVSSTSCFYTNHFWPCPSHTPRDCFNIKTRYWDPHYKDKRSWDHFISL